MATDQAKEKTVDTPPVDLARWSRSVWARFVLVIVLVLLVDLGLKAWAFGGHAWSFTNYGDSTVMVRTAEEGGPEVIMPASGQADWQVVSSVGPNGEPPRVPQHVAIEAVPGLLNFQLTLNTGAVFGTGQGGRPIFIAVSLVATVVILFLLYRSPRRAWGYQVGMALILGGALGNLYDRVRFSAVRDMLHMLPSTGLWPWIFNPADVALVIGVGLVLLVSYLSDRKAKKASLA